MKKLRLELDELQVESFAIDRGEHERGTVEGQISARCSAGERTCNDGDTCVYGNGNTCGGEVSCAGSCPAPCTNENSYCYNNSCFNCSYPAICTYP